MKDIGEHQGSKSGVYQLRFLFATQDNEVAGGKFCSLNLGFSPRKGSWATFPITPFIRTWFGSLVDAIVLRPMLERIAATFRQYASFCPGATQSAKSFHDIRFS